MSVLESIVVDYLAYILLLDDSYLSVSYSVENTSNETGARSSAGFARSCS